MDQQQIRYSFCAHVVLYAKGWYGAKHDIISDLRPLLAEYAYLDIRHVSNNDIRSFILNTFCAVVNPRLQPEALAEALGWRQTGIMRDTPEEVLLGSISICDGEWAHKDLILTEFIRR